MINSIGTSFYDFPNPKPRLKVANFYLGWPNSAGGGVGCVGVKILELWCLQQTQKVTSAATATSLATTGGKTTTTQRPNNRGPNLLSKVQTQLLLEDQTLTQDSYHSNPSDNLMMPTENMLIHSTCDRYEIDLDNLK